MRTFKKLNEKLKETLSELNFKEALPLQKEIFPVIKSGKNAIIIADEDKGKTTSLILYTIHKLKAEAKDDSPRAMIYVKDKQAALKLRDEFNLFTKNTDLRVYSVYEQQTFDQQKDDIYYGVDILIGTPKRINELFLKNGIHVSELQLFVIHDAEFTYRSSQSREVYRIPESLTKCQFLIFANTYNKRLENFKNSFMENAILIKQ